MSLISLPKGFLKQDGAFAANSMIDLLFDYDSYLKNNKPDLWRFDKEIEVLIVGAGAAGLVAAYELTKLSPKIKVSIIEASNRVGGRMFSRIFQDGEQTKPKGIFQDDVLTKPKVFELGCMRFPPTSRALYHYFKVFGVRTAENFPDPGKVDTKLYYENETYDWKAGSLTPDNPTFQRIGRGFVNVITYLLGDANNPDKYPDKLYYFWNKYQIDISQKPGVIVAWQVIIDKYANVSFYDAMFKLASNKDIINFGGTTKDPGWTEDDMNAFGALGVGSGGFGSLFTINFLEFIRIIANGWENAQELVPSGIQELVDKLSRAVEQQNLILNARVQFQTRGDRGPLEGSIMYTNNEYILHYEKADYRYDAVIVATTTQAMSAMNLGMTNNAADPALRFLNNSSGAKVAIRNLHTMSSAKFFILTGEKFWLKDPTLPQNIQSDQLFRGVYCLDYDEGKTGSNGYGVVLVSYVWGDDSTKLLAMSAEERYTLFYKAIYQAHKGFAVNLELTRLTGIVDNFPFEYGGNYINWENFPNYYGAFKLNSPGQEYDCHNLVFQYQDPQPTATNIPKNLFLAGDSVSYAGGWLEGAITSGINAATAVAYKFASVKPPIQSTPLGIDKNMYKY